MRKYVRVLVIFFTLLIAATLVFSATSQIRIASYFNNPDMFIKSITVPATITAGQTVTVNVVANVTNGNGTQVTGLGAWDVNVSLWQTTFPSGGVDITTWSNTSAVGGISDFSPVLLSDFDADGDLDILSSDLSASGKIVLWSNPKSANIALWTNTSTYAGTSCGGAAGVNGLAVGDIDNDGKIDIINSDCTKIVVWKNPGSANIALWTNTSTYAWGSNVWGITAGDIDRDGYLDLVSGAGDGITDGAIILWDNPGSSNIATWSNTTRTPVGLAPVVTSADVDADGDLDIIYESLDVDPENVTILENVGGMNIATWTSSSATTAGYFSDMFYSLPIPAGDLDLDGKLDFLSTGGNRIASNKLLAWDNPGSADVSTWSNTSNTNALVPYGVHDLDGDGDLDIVASNAAGTKLVILRNPGNSADISAWASTSAAAGLIRSAAVGDVDNDGALEIVSASATEVTIWNNAQTTMSYIGSTTKTFTNNSGTEQTYSIQWTAPSTTGFYYLTAIVDNAQKYSDVLRNNDRLLINVTVVEATTSREGDSVQVDAESLTQAGLEEPIVEAVLAGEAAFASAQITKDLNDSKVFSSNGLTDDDIIGLWDGEMSVSIGELKKDYDTHEQVMFYGPSLETGLTHGEKGFGDDVCLVIKRDEIKYEYVFDDELKIDNTPKNATSSDPFFIDVLGDELRIIEANTKEFTVVSGQYKALDTGKTELINNKSVTLVTVTSDWALFNVDGTQRWIREGNALEINELDIYLKQVHDISNSRQDVAEVHVSDSDAKTTYQDNDPFIGEPAKDPVWRWSIDSLDTVRPSLNVTFSQSWNKKEEVICAGDSLSFPNDYITLRLTNLTQTYRTYQIETTTEDLYEDTDSGDSTTQSSAKVIHFSCIFTCDDSAFKTPSGKESDDIYIYNINNTHLGVYYKDKRSGRAILDANQTIDQNSNVFDMQYKDSTLDVKVNSSASRTKSRGINWTFDETLSYAGDGKVLVLYTENSSATEFTYLGHSDGQTTVTNDWRYDVNYVGNPITGTDISKYAENVRTSAGIVLENPKSGASSDVFVLKLPEDIRSFGVGVVAYQQKDETPCIMESGDTKIHSQDEACSFDINGIAYLLSVEEITEDTVTFNVSNQVISIPIETSKQINVDKGYAYDITITVHGITDGKVLYTFETISGASIGNVSIPDSVEGSVIRNTGVVGAIAASAASAFSIAYFVNRHRKGKRCKYLKRRSKWLTKRLRHQV